MPAPYNPPLRGEDFVLRVSLQDMALPGSFKLNPTIEAGDFKVDKDGVALMPLTVLPIVQPAGSVLVKVSLTANEMDADVVTIVGIDQTTPKQWADFVLSIPTAGDDAFDVPLVLEHDGETTQSLIMNVGSDGEGTLYGGSILTQTTGLLPSNVINGYDDQGYRGVNIGGFLGARDPNEVWVWLDGDTDITAPADGGSPVLIMEGPAVPYDPGTITSIADLHIVHDISGKNFANLGWDVSNNTQFNFDIGTFSSGVQKDLVFTAKDIEKWRIAYSAGSHFLPGTHNTLDIGAPAKTLRNVHSRAVTLGQSPDFLSGGTVFAKSDDYATPVTVIHGGDQGDYGMPGYRFRAIDIGGGGWGGVDPNGITLWCDGNYEDTAPPNAAIPIAFIQPTDFGLFGPTLSVWENHDVCDHYASLGWDSATAPTRFNFEVGWQQVGSQKDLVFCADAKNEKWRMAYSSGSHFLPGTTNTQDIGSPTKAVRKTHTIGIDMPDDAAAIRMGATLGTILSSYDGASFNVTNPTTGGSLFLYRAGTDPTPATNPEYLGIYSYGPDGWGIGSFGDGTGIGRDIWIQNWGLENASDGGGHLKTFVDNLYDIGIPGGRPRTINAGTKVVTPAVEMPNNASIAMGAGAAKYKIFHDNYGVNIGSEGNYFGLTFFNNNINSMVNSEYMTITTTGTTYVIYSDKAGTGIARNIQIQNWNMGSQTAPAMVPGTTNAQDIGSATKFVRNIFTATMRWLAGVAPGAPVDGDMWFTGTALQMRVGGVTKTIQMA